MYYFNLNHNDHPLFRFQPTSDTDAVTVSGGYCLKMYWLVKYIKYSIILFFAILLCHTTCHRFQVCVRYPHDIMI